MLDLLTTAGASLANLRYNYSEIAAEHRETVREAAIDIRQRTKRASEDIVAIGRKLCEVKELLPHGQFTDWVTEEFDMSIRTAQRLMSVAERLGPKSDTVTLLNTSVLYLLAAPSTPDAAIDAVVEQAQTGKEVTKAEAKQIIADLKPVRTLNDRETEVVVWRAIKHSGVNGPSAQSAWLLDAPRETFAAMLMPGVTLDPSTLSDAVQSVIGQLQRQAGREQPAEPTGRPTRAATTPAAIIAPPQPTTPQNEPVASAEDDEDWEDVSSEVEGLAQRHEEEAAYSQMLHERSADADRQNMVGSLLTIYRRVINTLPDYEAVTGCYSHAGQLRRALETAIKDLEGNRV